MRIVCQKHSWLKTYLNEGRFLLQAKFHRSSILVTVLPIYIKQIKQCPLALNQAKTLQYLVIARGHCPMCLCVSNTLCPVLVTCINIPPHVNTCCSIHFNKELQNKQCF